MRSPFFLEGAQEFARLVNAEIALKIIVLCAFVDFLGKTYYQEDEVNYITSWMVLSLRPS